MLEVWVDVEVFGGVAGEEGNWYWGGGVGWWW